VDFVDDNFIGNKKALKAFLPELAAWQRAHGQPFEFSTEASVNLADDQALLEAMKAASFFSIFVGIESPDPDSLVAMKKKQNTRRNLVESIHRIYRAGIFVTAGFIVGFDSEKTSVAEAMIDFIEDSAIPICMVGLLYALPNTQLTRRLARERRLHLDHDIAATSGGDQCITGLNFDTQRPLRDILQDYRRILERVYDPAAYAARLDRLVTLLDRSGRARDLPEGDSRSKMGALDFVHRVVTEIPQAREIFWRTFMNCAKSNPAALRIVVAHLVLYLHLGPFSHQVIAAIDRRIAALAGNAIQDPGPIDAARVPAVEPGIGASM
jgi:radical SAM superfamily enzyme YgiQ (UPF0313 family)